MNNVTAAKVPEGLPVGPCQRVLLVVAHPRRDSLTSQVAERFADAVRTGGGVVELADLVSEQFDPVLRELDEPDWENPDKVYSPSVMREMERIRRNNATVMVFPVYWWSMPAILKGWVDRVWNNGFAYGVRNYPHRRVWLIGVAGNGKGEYSKRRYDEAMRISLSVGVLDYCGIPEPRLELLHGTMDGPEVPPEILCSAERLGREFTLLDSCCRGGETAPRVGLSPPARD